MFELVSVGIVLAEVLIFFLKKSTIFICILLLLHICCYLSFSIDPNIVEKLRKNFNDCICVICVAI